MPRKRVRIGIDQTLIAPALSSRSPGRPCRWRAAAARRRRPPGAAPTSAGGPRPPSRAPRRGRASPTTNATTRFPHSSSGTPTTSAALDVRVLAQPRGDRRRRHVHPAADHDVVEPAEHVQPAVLVEPAGVGGQEPAVDQGLGGRVRVAVVPVEQRRARRSGSGRPPPIASADAVERVAVVDAAAGGLGRAVRRHDAHPGRLRPRRAAPGRSGRRRAARCAARRSAVGLGRVVEQPVQLGRHQRDEAGAGVDRRRDRARPRAAPARGPRPATGTTTCTPRRTTPAARAATARCRRAGARSRRPRRAPPGATADPLGCAGRARGLHDQRLGSSAPPARPPSAATTSRGVPTGCRKFTRRTLVPHCQNPVR